MSRTAHNIAWFFLSLSIGIFLLWAMQGCGAGQTPSAVSMDITRWDIRFSPGMSHPAADGSGWFVDLPTAPDALHYIQTSVHPLPATVHVYIERRGDDLSKYYYRWWSQEHYTFHDGTGSDTVTLSVPLSADRWVDVDGCYPGAPDLACPSLFEDAVADIGAVGVTFGGQEFYGHGVGLNSGSARVTMISYELQ